MSMRSFLTWVLLLGLATQPVLAQDRITGTVDFVRRCPGDKSQDDASEFFLGALLTPLLTGVLNQGLKTAGAKLSEAAQEKSVDVIHRGEHLYEWRSGGFQLEFGCLIVASKGTEKSPRSLAGLVADYQAIELDNQGSTKTLIDGKAALADKLVEMGFSDALLPGIVGVFDIELSAQRAGARLVPRFVVMDHSIREKKTDKKQRTMTFEVSMTSPSLPKPFASLLIKFEKLAIAKPFFQDEKRPVTSSWFPLPAPASRTAAALKAYKTNKQVAASELETAKRAGKAAVALQDPTIGAYLGATPPCPSSAKARKLWGKTHAELENEKTKTKPNDVPRLTSALQYYKSCRQHLVLTSQYEEAEKELAKGTGAFDVTVTIKEFRKRPFAEFFGGVLSDAATRSALTSALVGEIDPATKKKTEEEEQKEALTARQAYEEAVVAAEIAIAKYDPNAAESAEKLTLYLDMEAKKRTANRRAEAIGLPAPYPESGSWFG